jgi:hypothetical protein
MAADNIAKAQAAPTRRQNLVKRACDPCKVRKIKCSELSPCSGCITAGIECTFNRLPSTRGPRTLRAKTIRRIAKTRQDGGSQPADLASTAEGDTMALLEMLDVYGGRLFPIWPIVDAVQLSDTLRTDPSDHRALHLARSVALATTAQLKLNSTWQGDVDRIERDAQADKSDLLDSLRVSFFLHIHYENQSAGGTKSLLYLREAITVAQILRIDREATYASLPDAEQQLLRRILWLLFITERFVSFFSSHLV